MNLHELACEITIKEGGKQSLSVAQVKEVIKLLCEKIRENPFETIEAMYFTSKRQRKSALPKSRRKKRV